MHLVYNNVNYAFRNLVSGIHKKYIPTSRLPSRNGEVLQIEEPVIITYRYPQDRVLFNQARDVNPFFHVFESLWMLAGREDVAPLSYFNSNISNYSDNGKIFNGAYGNRWRNWRIPSGDIWIAVDQLLEIADRLKRNPYDRRVVLEMWSVHSDLMRPQYRDCCCNLSVLFSVQDNTYLNMTVYNRSNDMIWGTFGANVVHMSFLQEYMAARIGVKMGVYNQVSNNLHAYVDKWEPEKWLSDETPDWYRYPYHDGHATIKTMIPLVQNPVRFDRECAEFIDAKEDGVYTEPFLKDVASPMCLAYRHHKERDYVKAYEAANMIKADDWRWVSLRWLEKRHASWKSRTESHDHVESKQNGETSH